MFTKNIKLKMGQMKRPQPLLFMSIWNVQVVRLYNKYR